MLQSIAKILLIFSSPYLIPFYGVIFFSQFAIIRLRPLSLFLVGLVVTLFFSFILPYLAFCYMQRKGIIETRNLSKQQDRPIALSFAAISLLGAVYILFHLRSFMFIFIFLLCCSVCAFLASVLSSRWNISLHAMAAGTLAGCATFLMLTDISQFLAHPLQQLSIIYIGTGLMSSAELALERHNGRQQLLGFSAGFLTSVLVTYVTVFGFYLR